MVHHEYPQFTGEARRQVTIGEGVRKVVDDQNFIGMTRIVDMLRIRYGMTCEGIRKYFEKKTGKEISLPEWDEWMQQCDYVSSEM